MKGFSFIIPVYNCAAFLGDCINSILNMKLNNFEIVLVNDGSKDNSAEICDEFAKENNNIKVLHQENQGVSTARNNGIKVATYEYLIFIDADDTIESEKLKKVLKIIENDNEIDMLIFGLSFDYFYNGKLYRRDNKVYPEEDILTINECCENFYQLYINNSISPIWNKVFKKSIITENKIYLNKNMFLYEDMEFVIRYMAYCKKIYNSTEVVYHYRQSEDEGNAIRRLKRIDSVSDFIKQIEDALADLATAVNLSENNYFALKSMLPNMYLILLREKICASNRQQIKKISAETASWFSNKNKEIMCNLSDSDKKYLKLVVSGSVNKIILKRKISATRHKIAVFVKNTGAYKRLRK